MRRSVLVVNVLLALGLVAAPARADIQTTSRQTGALRVSWHGDAAAGCAAAGVCDVRGTLSASTRSGAVALSSLSTISGEGRPVRTPLADAIGALELSADSATVRVRSRSGTCAEPIDLSDSEFPLDAAPHGRFTVALGPGALSSGRCAGPVDQDFAALSLPGRLVGSPAHGATLDLGAVRSSVAGPYAVTITSTLALHLRTTRVKDRSARARRLPVRARPVPARGRHARTSRQVELTLDYRADPATGAVALDFAGEGAPGCEVLDACGATGSERYPLRVGGGRLELVASGPAPRHASVAAALRALRRGRLSVAADEEPGLSLVAGPVASSTRRPGAPPCLDSAPAPRSALLASAARRTLTLIAIAPTGTKGRCAGPLSGDVRPSGALGRVTLPLDGASTMRGTLGSSDAFTGPGWMGTRLVRLPIVLHRTTASVRVVRVER